MLPASVAQVKGNSYGPAPPPAARARTSSGLSGRHRPGARLVSRTGPMRVRTSRRTGWPTALAHAPDLAVAALVDDEAQDPRGQHADLGRRGHPVLELDPLAQASQGARGGRAALHLGHVLLGHPVGGVGQQLGQAPSLVRMSRPSVSRSRRPTGKTRGSAGHQRPSRWAGPGDRPPW
jgi:hypothetical protein